MTTTCRVEYRSGNRQADLRSRIVRCGLPTGHEGDHDEMIDGEAGIVTWADPDPDSRIRLPKSVIDMAGTLESAIGLRNISLLGLAGAAWLEGFKAGLGERQTP